MAKRPASRTRPVRGLARTDTATLRRELERRGRVLLARRDQLLTELSELEAELRALGAAGSPRPGARRRRPYTRNKKSLVEALRAALKGKTMSAAEAIEAIQAAGHRIGSRTFVTQVRIALGRREHFRRVARGRYTAK